MRRGDVCWARLRPRSGSEQQGRRPVVVISHDSFNQIDAWRSVIVVPLTTSGRQALRGPSVVPLPAADTGLTADSFAICHQITTLDRSKLDSPVGHLAREDLRRVGHGIVASCDLHGAFDRSGSEEPG